MTTEREAYLEALVAQKADMLRWARTDVSSQDVIDNIDEAISASAETVQAFRDKLTEPLRTHIEEANSLANMQDIAIEQLRREVAMLHKAVSVYPHLLPSEITGALANTQATAQSYEQEVEARGAVNALEDLLPIRERWTAASGKYWYMHIQQKIIELRSTQGVKNE